MSQTMSRTTRGDAPLTAASNAEAMAYEGERAVHRGNVPVGRSVTIDRPRQELYDFWRDFKNLPLFMDNITSVTIQDSERSHWSIAAPAGKTLEWDSTIIDDQPGHLIAWESQQGASVRNSGRVEFLDSSDGRGTVVRITLTCDPPNGAVGKLIAKLFQKAPRIQARQDLRRFKQLMETGEIATAMPPDAAPRA